MKSYPHAVDSDPVRHRIRREVVRTERVRREITIRLGSTQAIRLGAKLMFRGLVAKVRRRPVQLTLRSGAKRPPSVAMAEADLAAERSLAPATSDQADVRLK
jgi:hypothetical protein